MVFEGHSEIIYFSGNIDNLFSQLFELFSKRWKEMAGWFELEECDDIDFDSGKLPKLEGGEELRGFFFYKNARMLSRWEWTEDVLKAFGGEGPISMRMNYFNPIQIDYEAQVKEDHQIGESVSFACRIIGGFYEVELTLPQDPASDPFSKNILSEVTRLMRGISEGNNRQGDGVREK